MPWVMAAPDTSTWAPHQTNKYRPMMDESWIFVSRNSCTIAWVTAWILTDFFPFIPALSLVTVISCILVGVHTAVGWPSVPGRMLGHTR